MIDRVAAALGRPLLEVPVGFKWFVPGLLDGSRGHGRRGERRGCRCCASTAAVEHGQGRHRRLPAGRGADRPHGARSRARPTGAHRPIRGPGLPARGRPGHAGAEGGAGRALARPGDARPRWAASRSRRSSPMRRAMARPSAGSRSTARPTAGSRSGRPARRTWPRSTRRASWARSTSGGSSRRPRRSSRPSRADRRRTVTPFGTWAP